MPYLRKLKPSPVIWGLSHCDTYNNPVNCKSFLSEAPATNYSPYIRTSVRTPYVYKVHTNLKTNMNKFSDEKVFVLNPRAKCFTPRTHPSIHKFSEILDINPIAFDTYYIQNLGLKKKKN